MGRLELEFEFEFRPPYTAAVSFLSVFTITLD